MPTSVQSYIPANRVSLCTSVTESQGSHDSASHPSHQNRVFREELYCYVQNGPDAEDRLPSLLASIPN